MSSLNKLINLYDWFQEVYQDEVWMEEQDETFDEFVILAVEAER